MIGMRISAISFAVILLLACSCGKGKNKGVTGFPEDFNAMPDTARVAYVMSHAEPDSVARFICSAALGKVSGAKIDSLGIATNYAYEKYTGADLDNFSSEYDYYVSSMPLADKMRMYAMAGVEDPQGLGLQLGLEYMQAIRDRNMTADDVEKEIEAFHGACGEDEALYERFLIGFRTVLQVDGGQDVPPSIFEKYGK